MWVWSDGRHIVEELSLLCAVSDDVDIFGESFRNDVVEEIWCWFLECGELFRRFKTGRLNGAQ